MLYRCILSVVERPACKSRQEEAVFRTLQQEHFDRYALCCFRMNINLKRIYIAVHFGCRTESPYYSIE